MTAHHRELDVFGTTLHLAFEPKGWEEIRRLAAKSKERLDLWNELAGLGVTDTWIDATESMQHVAIGLDWKSLEPLPQASQISVAAHEAFHAAISIAAHHHIQVSVHNDETAAYLVGWISAWIWDRHP